MNNKLWYKQEAKEWKEGLPVGNGRLAAMVLGGLSKERIALNHEWLWRATNRDRDNEKSAHYLKEVRELLLAGNYEEGTVLANKAFGGKGGRSEEKSRVDPYQPVGDFYFELEQGQIKNYRRELDLDKGLVKVTYDTDKTTISRETITDLVNNQIIVRISGNGQKIGGNFYLHRIEDTDCKLSFSSKVNNKEDEDNTNIKSSLIMEGLFKEGLKFRVEAKIRTKGGIISEIDNKLKVANAEEILIFINIGTSVKGIKPEEECAKYPIPNKDWQEILKQHTIAMSKLYQGLKLDIDLPVNNLPTDERLRAYRQGKEDATLSLLYFNYGRYLLIASSAKGELPANLQGKWNEELNPPWESDYHHDINLEMNYWLAEPANLAESTEALFAFIERFVPHAKKAAKDIYGCKGVWFPIQTDAWGRSTPESYGWAVWIGAAAWLAQHMWWHYEYGQDISFLRERAYPFFKEVLAFYESYLIEDEQGTLQIVPSQSPENRFEGSGDLPVSICVSATMDVQLAKAVLNYALKSSEILGIDNDKREKWQEILSKLPEMKIGSKGQLLEWNQEFEEAEPQHRHISHLWGLYPGDEITAEKTPKLFEAARKSLELRLEAGGGHTGWSRAWTACCFARIGDSKKAWQHLKALISDFATDSLLDLHPPRIFQIDGNLGGSAAIIEMLFQSYQEELDFLPALPKAWPNGEIKGLRGRGGYNINIKWENKKLKEAEIIPLKDRICTIKNLSKDYCIQDNKGKEIEVEKISSGICFKVKGEKSYFIKGKKDCK